MAEGRQLFSYKGVEYDLPATYTKEQALTRIRGHLGEGASKPKVTSPKTSVGVLQGLKRGITEDVPYGLGTALDFTAGGLADLFGDTSSADAAFKQMEKRTAERKKLLATRNQTEEQGFGSKAAQAVVGALPQMLSSHATQSAEDVMAGATNTGALKSLGVNTGAQALGLLLPAGKGLVKGAAVGAATSAPLSFATDTLNKRINAGTGAAANYNKTAEDYLLEAVVGAGVGGALGPLGTQKKVTTKPEVAIDDRLNARLNQEASTALNKATLNKDLIPADLETPAPAGTNFEMKLAGGKGTKAGRKVSEAQQKARGTQLVEEPVTGLTPEEQAAQLDMFVEDNRRVVERNLQDELDAEFQQQLQRGQLEQEAASRAAVDTERNQYSQRDAQQQLYSTMFPEAENRARPTQQVDPAFEQQLLFGEPYSGKPEIPDVKRERALIQEGLGRNAYGSPELTKFGTSAIKVLGPDGKPISARGLGVDTTQNIPVGKEREFSALQEHLNSTENGSEISRRTNGFISEQALTALRKKQGGHFDPYVFAEGFKTAIKFIGDGVRNFGDFSKNMVAKFGAAVKPYLPQFWGEGKKHLDSTRKETLSFIQKHGIPLRETLNHLKDTDSLMYLNEATRRLADVMDNFKSKVYNQEYDKRWYSSGMKWGDQAPIVRFFKNKDKDSMLKKYAPYMNTNQVVNPRALGWSDGEISAYLDLRDALDTIGTMEGIDVSANKNYFPRMRVGKYLVISKDPAGNTHVEASDGISSNSLARKLQAEGHTVLAHGTKRDIYNSGTYKSLLADEFQAEGFLPDPFSSHRQQSSNVAGWTGQRGDPKDLTHALETYLKRAENGLKREALVPLVKEINKNLPADKAEALVKHLEKAVGLDFLHTPQFLRDIENTLNKTPAFSKYDTAINVSSKAFYWWKVITGMANGAQALLSGPLFGTIQLAKLTDEGVNPTKATGQILKSTVASTLGIEDARNNQIASRAERSGYIQNPTDLIGKGAMLGRGEKLTHARDMAFDPFRASRLEMKARKDFFVGMYNYYIKDLGLDSEKAFHKAGQNTLDAFVNLHPEDRAGWQGATGNILKPFSALTTYPIGMAAKLYQHMGRNVTSGQTKAVGALLVGSIVAGGLRGSPVSELMELGTALYNLYADDVDKLSSMDDTLIQMGEKYPEFAWAMNGMISEALGVDMSRSLGWPGLSTLIPAWQQVKGYAAEASNSALGTEFKTDSLVPPAPVAMYKAAKGAAGLLGDNGLNAGEREQAAQAALPRFAQKLMDTNKVYTGKGDLLGTVSSEANTAAKITGTRSLEEAGIRAKAAEMNKRTMAVQETKKGLLDSMVRSALYNKTFDQDKIAKTMEHLATVGSPVDQSELMEALTQEVITSSTDPTARAAMNKDVLRLILEYKQQQENNKYGKY